MTPRRCLNKTAPAVVLHGSMFSKLCAPAQGRVPCTRAAAQAAALRLLYHDAAKRPQQNRTCCGFAWFNVLKALCAGTGACALHTHSREAAALRLLYHDAAKRPQQNRIERGAFAQRAKCDRMGASRPARGCAFERGVFAQRAKCVRAAGLASPVGTANACRGKNPARSV